MMEERALRALAEAENTTKRLEREQEDRVRYANQALLRELLPVLDNLLLCVDHARNGADERVLGDAIELTADEFLETLERVGVEPVAVAAGDAFDPGAHEAVIREHDPAFSGSVVTKVLQKGFRYRDRLLRPAKVIVNADAS